MGLLCSKNSIEFGKIESVNKYLATQSASCILVTLKTYKNKNGQFKFCGHSIDQQEISKFITKYNTIITSLLPSMYKIMSSGYISKLIILVESTDREGAKTVLKTAGLEIIFG